MLVIEEKVLINNTPKEIYEIITNNKYYLWRSDLSEIKVIDDNHFIEYTKKKFPTFLNIVKKTKNKKYEVEISNNNLEEKLIIELKNIDNKTEFIIREEIELLNKKKILLSKIYLKKKQKKYIDDLIKELESKK